jgi:ribosomal protein L19
VFVLVCAAAAEASAHFNITVTDQGDGVYPVHYTIKEEGRYRISVFLDGAHIRVRHRDHASLAYVRRRHSSHHPYVDCDHREVRSC